MKRKTAFLAAIATALNCAVFTVPQTAQAATSIKAEFENGTFSDCQYNEGITWEQIDEDAEKNPCDMTGWSGDGYAYIDDKDSSVAVKVNAPADGFYALKISYIQCLGIPHKIQYLYVNGESQPGGIEAMNEYDRPNEECRGIGGSFGFNRFETPEDYMSSKELVHMLIDLVSRGSNFLLNIGPTADGRIPVIMQQKLLDIGD